MIVKICKKTAQTVSADKMRLKGNPAPLKVVLYMEKS